MPVRATSRPSAFVSLEALKAITKNQQVWELPSLGKKASVLKESNDKAEDYTLLLLRLPIQLEPQAGSLRGSRSFRILTSSKQLTSSCLFLQPKVHIVSLQFDKSGVVDIALAVSSAVTSLATVTARSCCGTVTFTTLPCGEGQCQGHSVG